MGWRGFVDEDRKTVFFWSQKAACTSLFTILADNISPRPTDKKYFHTNSQSYRTCLPLVRKKGYRSVILVRHPVTRIISAYFNKFCLYRGKSLQTRADLEPFAIELHDQWCRQNGQDSSDNLLTFEDFLAVVATMHANRRNPFTPINGHWDTQMPSFLCEQGFSYDHILHVESLDEDMATLAPQLGLHFTPRSMNKTPVAAVPHAGYLGNVPACQVAEYPFSYENFITPDTLTQIQQIYRGDFTQFGYPLEPGKAEPKHIPGTGQHWWRRIAGSMRATVLRR